MTAKIYYFTNYKNKGVVMRCLACNVILTEEEQQRKFTSADSSANPEDQYVMLCNDCLGIGTDDDLSDDLGLVQEEEEEDA